VLTSFRAKDFETVEEGDVDLVFFDSNSLISADATSSMCSVLKPVLVDSYRESVIRCEHDNISHLRGEALD